MQRVSFKTLFLLVVLLGLVIVQQLTAKAVCVTPEVVWLAEEPNEPGPEWIGSAGMRMRLDADDPNAPGPEVALGAPSSLKLDDDPNAPGPEIALGVLCAEPNDPGPEIALGLLCEEPNSPGPEVALGVRSMLRLSDDPNAPGPERV